MLAESQSKKHTLKVTNWILENPIKIEELITLISDKDLFVARNAAWVTNYICSMKQELITPYFEQLYHTILNTKIDGIKRNILCAWQGIQIPEEMNFYIADMCLHFLQNNKETVAVKAYSLSILQKLLPIIPELKEEILFEIEKQMPNSTAAFKYRAKAFLVYVNKL